MSSQAVAILLATLSASEPVRAALDVDASGLGAAGPAVEQRMAARGEAVLRDGDVLPARGAQDALITIRIDSLEDAIGYRYAFAVTRGGELVDGTRGAAECRACSEAELAETLDAALVRLIAQLPPEASEPDVPPPVVVAPPPATEAGPRWVVGPMGGTGIALTGIGALALGVGVGLAVAEPVLLDGNANRNSTVGVGGLSAAVVGTALAATGVVLMLVERSRSRRESAR